VAWAAAVFPQSKVLRKIVLIFLTVGNWHKGFDRLVEAVDNLKSTNVIAEDVIAQIGHGNYHPTNLRVIDFCSPSEFVGIVAESRVVVTHAGIGTIGQALALAKPVIVVPRKASLGENVDDHQYVTARQLESEGKVLVAYEVGDLPRKIKEAGTFIPSQNKVGAQRLIQTIEEFLENLAAEKEKQGKR
jgi:UDP-N-acetylglucosamine transferase subunit ALG13